jgi:hypothetical protein
MILITAFLNYKMTQNRLRLINAIRIGSHFPDHIKDNLNALPRFIITKNANIFFQMLAAETIKQVDEKSRVLILIYNSIQEANPFILFFAFLLLLFSYVYSSIIIKCIRRFKYNYTFIENTLAFLTKYHPVISKYRKAKVSMFIQKFLTTRITQQEK